MNKPLRQRVLEKYDKHCAYCGKKLRLNNMQMDHVIPKRRFKSLAHTIGFEYGVNDFRNLNPSCKVCNRFKGVWTVEEFRSELNEQVDRARKYSINFRMSLKFGLIEIKNKPVVFYFEEIKSFEEFWERNIKLKRET